MFWISVKEISADDSGMDVKKFRMGSVAETSATRISLRYHYEVRTGTSVTDVSMDIKTVFSIHNG